MKKYEKVLSIILFILTAAFLCFNVCTSSTEIIPVKIALCAASIIIAGLTNYCIFLLYKKNTCQQNYIKQYILLQRLSC